MSDLLQLIDGQIDLRQRRVLRGDQAVRLTTREAELLRYLSRFPGQPVSREELLRAVWGHKADTQTRALSLAVHRLRAKLEQDSANPRHLLTVRNVGYSFQPVAPVASTEASAEGDALFGRGPALQALTGRTDRVLTITGPPGCGKSWLARAYAQQQGSSTRHFALDGATDLLGRVAVGLGLSIQSARSTQQAIERIAFTLRSQDVSVCVLDDADAVLDDPLLAELIAQTPARFVLTARRAAGLGAAFELSPLSTAAAIALFRARAQGAHLDPQALEQLVEQLDRLPLAIELAAARSVLLSPTQMLDRLDDLQRLLRRRRGDGLRESIAWSWSALSEPLRRFLARLAAFQGSFALTAAAAVAEGLGDEIWAVEALADLSAHHLLEMRGGEPRRYALYHSIQRFVAEQAPREVAIGATLHRRYYAQRSEPLQDRAQPGYDAIEALSAEAEEIQHALETAFSTNSEEIGVLTLAAFTLLRKRWPLRARGALLDRALARRHPPRIEINLRLTRAELFHRRGESDAARRDATYAQQKAAEIGASSLESLAWRLLAINRLGEPDAVNVALDRAVQVNNDARTRGLTGLVRGILAQSLGQTADAREHFENALEEGTRCADPELRLSAHLYLGQLHRRFHNLEAARSHYGEGLRLAERHDWNTSVTSALHNLGTLAFQEEDMIEAEAWFSRALASWRRSSRPGPTALILVDLNDVYAIQGDHAKARAGYQSALDERYSPMLRGLALSGLAWLDHQEGDPDRAARRLQEALVVLESLGFPELLAATHLSRAAYLADSDRPRAARQALTAATEILGDIDGTRFAVMMRLIEGHILAAEGDLDAARARLGEGEHALGIQLDALNRRRLLMNTPTGIATSSGVLIQTPFFRRGVEMLRAAIRAREAGR